jgi:hypothetical protein
MCTSLKLVKIVAGFTVLALLALPGRAQVTVTYVGASSGGTMAGSDTDFFFPNTTNFPGYPGTAYSTDTTAPTSLPYADLTSFYVFGGISSQNSGSGFSSIVTPAGGSPTPTGDLIAAGDVSFGLIPGLTQNFFGATAAGLNANFNYNDFYIYLMYSNVGGTLIDTTVTVAPDYFDGSNLGSVGTAVTIDLNGGSGPLDAPEDNNTTSTTAKYLEFHVQGLGAEIPVANADGKLAFINVSATGSTGNTYIGAVSFEVPEPSTWAMLLGGVGMLLAGQRLRRKSSL